MNPGEFVFLIALPLSVSAIASWLNHLSVVKFSAVSAVLSLACGITALGTLGRTPTGGDLLVWALVCVLPISTAFLVARWHAVRRWRLVAGGLAVVGYFVALLVGVNIGMTAGVLVH